MEYTKKNRVDVIGKVSSINIIQDSNERIGEYIRGDIVIESTVSGVTMNIPMQFFAKPLTNSGAPRKLYKQLLELQNGERISITGSLQDNRFWSEQSGQIIQAKRLNISFINPVKATDADKATFSYSGFVVSELQEITNKDDTTQWQIKIGQENYQKTLAEVITFNVDPQNTQAINYIAANYKVGNTVKLVGELNYDVVTETREEPTEFGAPVTRTFQRNISELIIQSGVTVDTGIYDDERIKELIAGTKSLDAQLQEDAKNKEVSGKSVSNQKPLSTKAVNQSLI